MMKISSTLVQCLELEFLSQSSANQRKGRTGRTCEGVCYRMYTEDKYNSLPPLCGNEIDNAPLHKPLIDLLEANLNPESIMDDMPRERIKSDIAFLLQIKVLIESKSREGINLLIVHFPTHITNNHVIIR